MLAYLNTTIQSTCHKVDEYLPKIPEKALKTAKGIKFTVGVLVLSKACYDIYNGNSVNVTASLVAAGTLSCFHALTTYLEQRKERLEVTSNVTTALVNRAKGLYPALSGQNNEMILKVLFAPATPASPAGPIANLIPNMTFDYAVKMMAAIPNKKDRNYSELASEFLPLPPQNNLRAEEEGLN